MTATQGALDLGAERMRWSPLQSAIFAAVEDPDGGNLAVRARAGTGKTTVIAECVRRMPRRARILTCAFNREIREELAKRLPVSVDVLTTHGLGMRAITRTVERSHLDKDRLKNLLQTADFWPGADAGPWRHAAGKVVARAKATLARSADELHQVVDEAGVCLEDLVPRQRRTRDGLSEAQAAELKTQLVEACGRALVACAEDPRAFDFDDMLWLPVMHGWPVGQWDWVVVDEAQDLSRVQLELIAGALAPGGRILVVGDDRQAIYRFRGADPGAFDRLATRFACRVLPLSITYRCPTTVVDLARRLVADYEAGPTAAVGEVTRAAELLPQHLRAGDFVLSRKNAPLVRHAIRALAGGIPAAIAGRELSKNLGLILSTMARRYGDNRDAVVEAIETHYGRRLAEAAKRDIDAAPLRDELDCLLALLDAQDTVRGAVALLDRLCAEKPGNCVLFSSVHRAKGLERDRVWLLTGTFRASFNDNEAPGEESNLLYVAATRAKRSLVLVSGKG